VEKCSDRQDLKDERIDDESVILSVHCVEISDRNDCRAFRTFHPDCKEVLLPN
jgi:hypothetical protein